MINFRYHIVSLTGVFLALIIGILMGTTVVSRATVDGLKANLQRAETRSAAVHRTNDQLSGELSRRTKTDDEIDKALTEHVTTQAVGGVLDGVPVLVITTGGADKDLVDRMVTALDDAGASVDGTLVLNDRLAGTESDLEPLRDPLEVPVRRGVRATVIRQLAVALGAAALPGVPLHGVPTTTTSTTTTIAGPDDSIDDTPDATGQVDPTNPTATTLLGVPGSSTPATTIPEAPSEPEILSLLRSSGFVDVRPAPGRDAKAPLLEAAEYGEGTGYRYVVIAPTKPSSVDEQVLIPLIAQVAALGPVAQVVATGPQDRSNPGDDPFLKPLLGRDGVAGKVSTVDNLGSFEGTVATIYALVAAGDGHFGSYGIGRTASDVIPSLGG